MPQIYLFEASLGKLLCNGGIAWHQSLIRQFLQSHLPFCKREGRTCLKCGQEWISDNSGQSKVWMRKDLRKMQIWPGRRWILGEKFCCQKTTHLNEGIWLMLLRSDWNIPSSLRLICWVIPRRRVVYFTTDTCLIPDNADYALDPTAAIVSVCHQCQGVASL